MCMWHSIVNRFCTFWFFRCSNGRFGWKGAKITQEIKVTTWLIRSLITRTQLRQTELFILRKKCPVLIGFMSPRFSPDCLGNICRREEPASVSAPEHFLHFCTFASSNIVSVLKSPTLLGTQACFWIGLHFEHSLAQTQTCSINQQEAERASVLQTTIYQFTIRKLCFLSSFYSQNSLNGKNRIYNGGEKEA